MFQKEDGKQGQGDKRDEERDKPEGARAPWNRWPDVDWGLPDGEDGDIEDVDDEDEVKAA